MSGTGRVSDEKDGMIMGRLRCTFFKQYFVKGSLEKTSCPSQNLTGIEIDRD